MATAKTRDRDPQETVNLPSPDGSSQDGPSVNDQAVSLQAQTGQIVSKNEAIMQDFVTWLVGKADTTDEDQYALMASIIADIRQSSSPEEVLRERSALHVRDILNTPLVLHGFEIRQGDFEDSELNYYAAMTVGRQGREDTRVVTSGATKVLGKLWVLEEMGVWPQVIWFTGKQTSKGYQSLDMVSPTV